MMKKILPLGLRREDVLNSREHRGERKQIEIYQQKPVEGRERLWFERVEIEGEMKNVYLSPIDL